jgi:hypothetical protein
MASSSVVLEKQTGHPADSMVSRKRKKEVSHSQAYELVRLVQEYTQQHPGILDSGEVLVTLPSTGHEQLPYEIEPPTSTWPIPRLPLADAWANEPKVVQECYQEVYTYHLVNAVQSLTRALEHPHGSETPVRDISVGFGPDKDRLLVYCRDFKAYFLRVPAAKEDESDMDTLFAEQIDSSLTTNDQTRVQLAELTERLHVRRARARELVAQLSTLNERENLSVPELRLRSLQLTTDDIQAFSNFDTLAEAVCSQQEVIRSAQAAYDEKVPRN